MNRRNFILKTALAGSSVLITSQTLAMSTVPGKRPASVLVIGAGFAGLAAAYKLTQLGIKVTVLEARNRIGGRVFSHKPQQGEGQVIELGAEWVGASHQRVIELCESFGLTLENNQFDTDLTLTGQHSPTGQWSLSPTMEAFWTEKRNCLGPCQRRKNESWTGQTGGDFCMKKD